MESTAFHSELRNSRTLKAPAIKLMIFADQRHLVRLLLQSVTFLQSVPSLNVNQRKKAYHAT